MCKVFRLLSTNKKTLFKNVRILIVFIKFYNLRKIIIKSTINYIFVLLIKKLNNKGLY